MQNFLTGRKFLDTSLAPSVGSGSFLSYEFAHAPLARHSVPSDSLGLPRLTLAKRMRDRPEDENGYALGDIRSRRCVGYPTRLGLRAGWKPFMGRQCDDAARHLGRPPDISLLTHSLCSLPSGSG